jgi:LCP family protein required for cell wall assembly
MDDIYFSDKPNQHKAPKKANGNGTIHTDDAAQDTFSGDPVVPAKEKFVVHMPDQERAVVLPDRTPKGRPVKTDAVEPRVPDYTPTQTSKFDDSAYLKPKTPSAQPQQPSMQYRPAQPRPRVDNRPRPTQQGASGQKRRKKKKGGKGKVILAILLVIAIALTGLFAYGYAILGKVGYDKDYNSTNPYVDASALARSDRVRNILCIGADARSDVEGNRSDTMILLSIDNAHHQLKMTSFLRDSYVYVPAKGFNAKLNAAFAWGGAQMLVDTIEYNFKVDIDDYVIIDFVGFQKLIDLMGGLDVDGVTAAEAKYMRDVVKIVYCKEGKNHFTGAAALWYCRIRKLDDDFHRTERQRKVINAIMKQALRQNPFKLMKIIEQVLPMIQTSLSRNDLLGVGFSTVFNYIGGKKPQQQIPAEDTWRGQRINGQDVLRLDFDRNTEILKSFLYD